MCDINLPEERVVASVLRAGFFSLVLSAPLLNLKTGHRAGEFPIQTNRLG